MYCFTSKINQGARFFEATNERDALAEFQESTQLSTRDFLKVYGHWLCYAGSAFNDSLFIDTVENLF